MIPGRISYKSLHRRNARLLVLAQQNLIIFWQPLRYTWFENTVKQVAFKYVTVAGNASYPISTLSEQTSLNTGVLCHLHFEIFVNFTPKYKRTIIYDIVSITVSSKRKAGEKGKKKKKKQETKLQSTSFYLEAHVCTSRICLFSVRVCQHYSFPQSDSK